MAQFDDEPKVDSWVYQSFKLVYDAGLIKGYPDGTFKGDRPATRNEVVEFLARLMNYFDQKLVGLTPAAPDTAAPAKECLSKEEVKALIAEELTTKATGATQEDLKALSDDVFTAIQTLEGQFLDELKQLDVRVTTLEQQVEAIQAKDTSQDAAIAKLQADLQATNKALDTTSKSLDATKAQAAQDVANAQEETKKAKTMGIIGALLAILAFL